MLNITGVNQINYNRYSNHKNTNFRGKQNVVAALKNEDINIELAKTIIKSIKDGYSFLGAVAKSTKTSSEEHSLNKLCDRILELRFNSINGEKQVYKLYFRNIPEPLQTAISIISKTA